MNIMKNLENVKIEWICENEYTGVKILIKLNCSSGETAGQAANHGPENLRCGEDVDEIQW